MRRDPTRDQRTPRQDGAIRAPIPNPAALPPPGNNNPSSGAPPRRPDRPDAARAHPHVAALSLQRAGAGAEVLAGAAAGSSEQAAASPAAAAAGGRRRGLGFAPPPPPPGMGLRSWAAARGRPFLEHPPSHWLAPPAALPHNPTPVAARPRPPARAPRAAAGVLGRTWSFLMTRAGAERIERAELG